MARMELIRVVCDRCKREHFVIPSPAGQAPKQPDFEARFLDKKLKYDDICQSCKETLENVWKDLAEWEREIKQRFGPVLDPNQAAPVTPAPNYTPPQPHSAAASKK